MKTLCIYHKNCFDGICAAWVVSKRFPGMTFDPMNYGEAIPIYWSDYDKIIFVDFSLPREQMLFLDKSFELLVIDHHKTAEVNLKGLPFAIFDMNESGASLAWKYFFPNRELPFLVRYIKDRDLWLFKEDNSEDINSYIQSFSMKIEEYELLYNELEQPQGIMTARVAGQAINRYKNQMVKNMCNNAAFDKNGIPTVNASMLFSEVGHELCKMFPNAPYAQYYFDRLKDNTRQWGARSIGDFDVSEIAKQNGGGGHKNAAGWQHSLSEF